MQLVLDLDNGVSVTATPFSASDGTLGLDFQAQTPAGPMGLRATTTEAAVRNMIALGKAKFGPKIAAFLNRVLGMSGMPPMPFSPEPVMVDAVANSVGRASGNGDPYNPGGSSSDDMSMGARASVGRMGFTANGGIENKKGNPLAGLTGVGEGPMSAGLWAHGPYAVTVPVTYRTLQPWTTPIPWWWPKAWAWHGPLPVSPPNMSMSGAASVAGCCGGRIRTQVQNENASMGIILQGGRPRAPSAPSMLQMTHNMMTGRSNGLGVSIGAPPNDPNNPNGSPPTPMPPVYFTPGPGPFTTMPWTPGMPPPAGYTPPPDYGTPQSDPYGFSGTPGYSEPVMLPPNAFVQEGLVPDASRFDTSPVERALSCAQRLYSRPGYYGTVLGSTYAATVLACAYSDAVIRSVGPTRVAAAPTHYQSALAIAIRRKVTMLGRKVTAIEVAELATAVVEVRGRASPIAGYTWGGQRYTWGNRGSVGALPGMPGGDMFQFVPPPPSPGNMPFQPPIPFVPGPFSPAPPGPPAPPAPPAPPFTLSPLSPRIPFETMVLKPFISTGCWTWCNSAGRVCIEPTEPGAHRCALYQRASEIGRPGPQLVFPNSAEPFDGVAGRIKMDTGSDVTAVPVGCIHCPGDASIGALPGMPGGNAMQFAPQFSPGNAPPPLPFVPGPFSPAPPAPPFAPPAFVAPTYAPPVVPYTPPTIGQPGGLPRQDFRDGVAAGKEACRRAKAGEHVEIDAYTLYGSGENPGWLQTDYARGYRAGLQSGGCAPICDPSAVNGSHYMVSGAPDALGYWPTYPARDASGAIVSPCSESSVGALFGGTRPFVAPSGVRPFGGLRAPISPISKSEYDSGYKLGTEDVRRVRTGAVVYMPRWVLTAGSSYIAGYSQGVVDAGGRRVSEDLLHIRIVVDPLPGLRVGDDLSEYDNGRRVAGEDIARALKSTGPTLTPDFRSASDDFRSGYAYAIEDAYVNGDYGIRGLRVCFSPAEPVEGRFVLMGGLPCGGIPSPRTRLRRLYPGVPDYSSPGSSLPGENLLYNVI